MVYLLCVGFLNADESYVSPGFITEALFIIHNKHNDLSEYIMRLKKMLTKCLKIVKKKDNNPSFVSQIVRHPCSFKENLFSSSIKELEELLCILNQSLIELSKKEQFTQSFVRSHVDRAFVIKRKIDTESLLIDHMLKARKAQDSLAKVEKSLRLSVRKHDRLKLLPISARVTRSLGRVERDRSFLKKVRIRLQLEIARNTTVRTTLKRTLRRIDDDLYKDYKGKRRNRVVNLA